MTPYKEMEDQVKANKRYRERKKTKLLADLASTFPDIRAFMYYPINDINKVDMYAVLLQVCWDWRRKYLGESDLTMLTLEGSAAEWKKYGITNEMVNQGLVLEAKKE